ncbi:MAG TPA: hypothetical protein VJI13_01695 [Candidatus Norongarragalinales archaeon]|nr:hypothetical protein [Candidatus Norongarragalinales archaeon]
MGKNAPEREARIQVKFGGGRVIVSDGQIVHEVGLPRSPVAYTEPSARFRRIADKHPDGTQVTYRTVETRYKGRTSHNILIEYFNTPTPDFQRTMRDIIGLVRQVNERHTPVSGLGLVALGRTWVFSPLNRRWLERVARREGFKVEQDPGDPQTEKAYVGSIKRGLAKVEGRIAELASSRKRNARIGISRWRKAESDARVALIALRTSVRKRNPTNQDHRAILKSLSVLNRRLGPALAHYLLQEAYTSFSLKPV